MKILFLHQKDNVKGNILWKQNSVLFEDIEKLVENIRNKGYFFSLFPEGDGITFSHDNYNGDEAISLFKEKFPNFDFDEVKEGELNTKLAEINQGNMVNIRVIVPVEKVLLHKVIKIGKFTFYPAIDGFDFTEENHELSFLNEFGFSDFEKTYLEEINFLNYTLIDFEMQIDKSLIYLSKENFQEAEKLIKILIEEADKGLDLLRFENLSLHNIYWTFGLAGQISNNFSYAYIKELSNGCPVFKYGEILCGKSHILTVVNNWLGAEIDYGRISPETNKIYYNVYNNIDDDFYNLYRYSFRSFCQSVYNVNEEARFLQIIYAIDAISFIGKNQRGKDKTGKDHRTHIAILSGYKDGSDFENKARKYDILYKYRNKIVHKNKTFLNLGLDSIKETTDLGWYFVNIINNITNLGLNSELKIKNYVDSCIQKLSANITNLNDLGK